MRLSVLTVGHKRESIIEAYPLMVYYRILTDYGGKRVFVLAVHLGVAHQASMDHTKQGQSKDNPG